ncbi:hypothetical protein PCANC_13834 [Puccinia coronata f. sp. avenae]|uniref:Uncharacterized protein n=1 Tax=Puccinia coronata f. sp. avenae TaxID=200324 RepID=A0A2N5UD38_9BASI|nr:hypothetical protein PCANC_13834 [Puccinia coronata f. sp. avenae]
MNERTNEQTNERMNKQIDCQSSVVSPKPYASSNRSDQEKAPSTKKLGTSEQTPNPLTTYDSKRPSLRSLSSIAVTMEPSQISKRTHSELEEDIEELRMRDLRLRYKKLHPADSESDESFKTFFEDAGEHLVSKYLDHLEQFFSTLPEPVNSHRDSMWYCFLHASKITFPIIIEITFPIIIDNLSLQTDDMKNTAIELAFLWRFPLILRSN